MGPVRVTDAQHASAHQQTAHQVVVTIHRQRGDGRIVHAPVSCRVLSYQKDRIESALQTLPDAVLILDDAGAAIFVNSKFEPLLGVSPEKTLGTTVEEWCTDPQLVQLLTRYDGNVTRLMRSDRVEISPPGSRLWRLVFSKRYEVGRSLCARSGM